MSEPDIAGATPDQPTTAHSDSNYQALYNVGNELREDVDLAESLDFLELPTNGEASFSGTIGFELVQEASTDLIGEVQIGISFETGEIAGTAGNFVSSDDFLYIGELSISGEGLANQTEDTSSFIFQAELLGEIASDGTLVIDAILLGDFFESATALAGIVIGGIEDGSQSYSIEEGAFLAVVE